MNTDTLLKELREQGTGWTTLDIVWAVRAWQRTGNPRFMDYATVVCDTAGVRIGPVLQAELTEAANQRMQGKDRGTLAAVQREMEWFDALTRMAFHGWRGVNQTAAAEDVIEEMGLTCQFKTLYDYYSTMLKTPGLEIAVFETLDWYDEIEPLPTE